MAYRVPAFNLLCDVYSFGQWPTGTERLTGLPCQLRHPEHVSSGQAANTLPSQSAPHMLLLVPAGSDVRDTWQTPIGNPDTVEVEPGSGRAYQVVFVDDVAKGFDNEYRVAYLAKHTAMPTPLP